MAPGLLLSLHFFPMQIPFNFKFQFLTSSSGTNAIGILPGEYWGTPNDRPIIVGAHWDTVSTSPGYNDNGSGASALLVNYIFNINKFLTNIDKCLTNIDNF